MSLRRIVTVAATMIVAVLLALGVPFAQLQTVSDRSECCCPDPAKCKCPDHDPDESPQPSMRACHKRSIEGVTAQVPAFVPPALPFTLAPERIATSIVHVIATPHAAPPPRRPAAPS